MWRTYFGGAACPAGGVGLLPWWRGGLYGDRDAGIPLEQVEQLRARYPKVPIYIYTADHGFFNDERKPSFDAAAATVAFARTAEFFGRHLA